MVYIVMGVSGSGKTTIGRMLAEKLNLPFHDADDFHSAENVLKMKNGLPLTDEDRESWLEILANLLVKWEEGGGAILACSALKEDYRQTITSNSKNVQWIFLKGSKELVKERLLERKGHFMNRDLLDSQFEILEEPNYGIKVSIRNAPETIVEIIIEKLKTI